MKNLFCVLLMVSILAFQGCIQTTGEAINIVECTSHDDCIGDQICNIGACSSACPDISEKGISPGDIFCQCANTNKFGKGKMGAPDQDDMYRFTTIYGSDIVGDTMVFGHSIVIGGYDYKVQYNEDGTYDFDMDGDGTYEDEATCHIQKDPCDLMNCQKECFEGECVECFEDSHCTGSEVCAQNTCADPCYNLNQMEVGQTKYFTLDWQKHEVTVMVMSFGEDGAIYVKLIVDDEVTETLELGDSFQKGNLKATIASYTAIGDTNYVNLCITQIDSEPECTDNNDCNEYETCTNNICTLNCNNPQEFEVGQSKTYTINGLDYEITVLVVSGDSPSNYAAKFLVNDKVTDQYKQGETLEEGIVKMNIPEISYEDDKYKVVLCLVTSESECTQNTDCEDNEICVLEKCELACPQVKETEITDEFCACGGPNNRRVEIVEEGDDYTLLIDNEYYETTNTVTIEGVNYDLTKFGQNRRVDTDGDGYEENKITCPRECKYDNDCDSDTCLYGECILSCDKPINLLVGQTKNFGDYDVTVMVSSGSVIKLIIENTLTDKHIVSQQLDVGDHVVYENLKATFIGYTDDNGDYITLLCVEAYTQPDEDEEDEEDECKYIKEDDAKENECFKICGGSTEHEITITELDFSDKTITIKKGSDTSEYSFNTDNDGNSKASAIFSGIRYDFYIDGTSSSYTLSADTDADGKIEDGVTTCPKVVEKKVVTTEKPKQTTTTKPAPEPVPPKEPEPKKEPTVTPKEPKELEPVIPVQREDTEPVDDPADKVVNPVQDTVEEIEDEVRAPPKFVVAIINFFKLFFN